jgi:hypothetical protein
MIALLGEGENNVVSQLLEAQSVEPRRLRKHLEDAYG